MKTVKDFILGGSKITADGDYSHEIKRCLLLGKKVMTTLNSILKSRDITLPTKVHLVKAIVFPVVMYRCDEEEKLKFYITSSFCLCNSACPLQSLDHLGHIVSESGDLEY